MTPVFVSEKLIDSLSLVLGINNICILYCILDTMENVTKIQWMSSRRRGRYRSTTISLLTVHRHFFHACIVLYICPQLFSQSISFSFCLPVIVIRQFIDHTVVYFQTRSASQIISVAILSIVFFLLSRYFFLQAHRESNDICADVISVFLFPYEQLHIYLPIQRQTQSTFSAWFSEEEMVTKGAQWT